jgi:hypothetical protein
MRGRSSLTAFSMSLRKTSRPLPKQTSIVCFREKRPLSL